MEIAVLWPKIFKYEMTSPIAQDAKMNSECKKGSTTSRPILKIIIRIAKIEKVSKLKRHNLLLLIFISNKYKIYDGIKAVPEPIITGAA